MGVAPAFGVPVVEDAPIVLSLGPVGGTPEMRSSNKWH